MCACRQKKSFSIEHILRDDSEKTNPPTKCDHGGPFDLRNTRKHNSSYSSALQAFRSPEIELRSEQRNLSNLNSIQLNTARSNFDENMTKFGVTSEIRNELALNSFNINPEQRRNTYPLYPTAIKAGLPWRYGKELPQFSYYSEPILAPDHILRSQLASNRRFALSQFPRHYGYDRVQTTCCSPWWGMAGRRKGGQVRFSTTQTGALERRFSNSKYLSPDERRTLAASLRLSDRQVKTWFQNRRAKWRRTTPDSADVGSPNSEDASDDEGKLNADR